MTLDLTNQQGDSPKIDLACRYLTKILHIPEFQEKTLGHKTTYTPPEHTGTQMISLLFRKGQHSKFELKTEDMA